MSNGKEIAKIVGWTLFGITITIMYFGMFWAMSLSNMEIKTEHYIYMDSDNETKAMFEAIAKIKEAEDQTCIVKEVERLVDSETGLIHSQYIMNEYIDENCSYTSN